ncbi:hypothetical protein ND861_18220 [Leptospira sp. 2 VSF19]|nr:hypothetical protein [Leptospira soteropolitanensis]MCW7494543.1 hypothetical protein [Leptospira soteropolitanensis]MCW7528299.1 hypothetical protein [Leptospira soteropolitanensis]
MKMNNKSFKSGLVGISLALLMTANFVSCSDSGSKKEDNPTALLYLVNNSVVDSEVTANCVAAYTAANSCVGGKEYFNAGIGCSSKKLDGRTTDELKALKECVLSKVNDPIQPCNLPQFTYGLAQQALAGAFSACNKSYTTAAGLTVDLKDYLVY